MASVSRKDCKIPSNAPKDLLLTQHSDFIKKYGDEKEEYDYVMSEFLRINGVYWSLTAMDLMKHRDRLEREEIMSYVHSCYDAPTGGFAPAPRHDPHILYTLSAVQIAATYDAVAELDSEAIVKYVCGLQSAEDGSFMGDKWGEVDTRFSFCAVATLKLLGRLDACDVDKAVEFVESCKNFDGGFGSKPGSESHAGLIYCAVGFLSVTERLDVLDPDLLGWWLCERQLPSGGLNGRPEKLPDVCYSWWVLASLSVLGRLHWIDREKMVKFILASQDEETGGISDRPGDLPDPFHTLFGIAGLSMLGADDRLAEVNPVYCMSQDVIVRLKVMPQIMKL